ncbi:MAG: putative N-acyltransferase [Myxococcota bacterium]|jgi:predicted N-acyltransferase
MEVSVVDQISRVSAVEWDALAGADNPFIEHAFLHALEESGSVGGASGWVPAHVLVRDEGALVAAAPLYVKEHSYGEYIFDWGWAEASQRAGIPYYPKLVCAVPFTPATGRRLLSAGDAPTPEQARALVAGFHAVADATKAMSIHMLFSTEAERGLLAEEHRFIPRTTQQFHWHNNNYKSFDHWLEAFRSKDRKNARRERRRAMESIDRIRVVRGDEVTVAEWQVIRAFYQDTTSRKWGQAYLTDKFFDLIGPLLGQRALVFLAEKDDEIVASALTFQKGRHLYGRYWGGQPGFKDLHFELCYHRPIEECIRNGWTLFEAGAQGSHKVKRGLMPAPTWSAHWLRHTGLSDAVGRAMEQEDHMVRAQIDATEHGPFRRDGD